MAKTGNIANLAILNTCGSSFPKIGSAPFKQMDDAEFDLGPEHFTTTLALIASVIISLGLAAGLSFYFPPLGLREVDRIDGRERARSLK